MEEQVHSQAVDLKALAAELTSAHNALQLMTCITRHDIMNMITVQRGYMEIALESQRVQDYELAVRKSYPAALKIQELITFTREYQEIGTNRPSWTNLATIIRKVITLFHEEQDMIISTIPEHLEVYVDPLFEKVFFVLIDNALRHGMQVTGIRISHTEGHELRVYCEDNGVGIPADEKDTIFRKGIGKNTGLGLYLAREIMTINGCTLKEIGSPGTGGVFEIVIPADKWRDIPVQVT